MYFINLNALVSIIWYDYLISIIVEFVCNI